MHVAFLISDLKGGGAQKMIINLANWFAKNGHQCDLVLFQSDGLYQDLICKDVNVYDFNKSRSAYCISPTAKYIKNNKPDILFSALYHVNIVALIAHLLSFNKTTKIIVSERNHVTRYFQSWSKIKRFVWTRLIQFFYPYSNAIIGISNGVCLDLKAILPKRTHNRIETIYNPVVTDDFKDRLAQDVPDIYPENCSSKLITSGRLVEQKDYPTLLHSFARYLQHNETSHLAILGVGVLEKQIKQMAEDLKIDRHITFCGFVDEPLSYMKQANIFIMTSAWEGFCNVIVEALYCGLSIVSTDCPSGPSEILDGSKYGHLCPVGSVDCLSQSIIKVERDPYDADKQRKRALDFHVDKIGNQFLKKFKDLNDE